MVGQSELEPITIATFGIFFSLTLLVSQVSFNQLGVIPFTLETAVLLAAIPMIRSIRKIRMRIVA
tara:strand:- start:216 stop:410 length:195 start_codon:yes stop_codon:yes gene_type:complete